MQFDYVRLAQELYARKHVADRPNPVTLWQHQAPLGWTFRVLNIVAEADQLVLHWQAEAPSPSRHNGLGEEARPAPGAPICCRITSVIRIVDGQLVAEQTVNDESGIA